LTDPDSQRDPDWNLLPEHPAAFFGLKGGFGREDLKRAYVGLVRRFKPERDPDSFRRIRNAYESLLPWAGSWEPEEGVDFEGAGEPAPGDDSDSLLGELRAAGPEPLRRRLESAPGRSASGELALLLLRDAEDRFSDRRFSEALLDAVALHPEDDGLKALLGTWLRTAVPAGALPLLLRRAFRVLPPDAYVEITREPWRRYFTEGPAKEAQQLWEDLAGAPGHAHPDRAAYFRTEVLRSAAARADPAWVRDQLHLLAEESVVTGGFDGEIDLLEAVLDYREWAPRTLGDSKTARTLRALVAARCEGGLEEADDRFHAAMASLAADPDRVLADLPFFTREAGARLRILELLAGERDSGEIALDPAKEAEDHGWLIVDQFLAIDGQGASRWYRFLEGLRSFGVGSLRVLVFMGGILILLATFTSDRARPTVASILSYGIGTLLVLAPTLGFLLPAVRGFMESRTSVRRSRHYRTVWRPSLAAFLRTYHVHPNIFPSVCARRPEGARWAPLARQASLDPALRILWLAHRFAG